MERPTRERDQEGREVVELDGLNHGDRLRVVTESGSEYIFVVEEVVCSERFPESSRVVAQMTRESDTEVWGVHAVPTGVSTEVDLKGSCDEAMRVGSAGLHRGEFKVITGKPLAFRDAEDNLVVTNIVVKAELTRAETEADS